MQIILDSSEIRDVISRYVAETLMAADVCFMATAIELPSEEAVIVDVETESNWENCN